MELLHHKCIICHYHDARLWAQKDQYKTYQCLNCGFVYVHPVPAIEEIIKHYHSDYFIGYDPKKEKHDHRYLQRLNQYRIDIKHILKYISSGTILDFGCGNGKYLELFPSSFIKIGYEINPKAVEYLNTTNIGQFYTGDPSSIQAHDVDLVLMRGVIEHLPDPVSIAKFLSDKLKPGGYLFISATPNVDSPCAVLYKEKWNQFYMPDHLNYFSVRTLSFLMAKFGLTCIDAAFPYLETPYSNIDNDSQQWLKDTKSFFSENMRGSAKSPVFVGNMLSIVFKKQDF